MQYETDAFRVMRAAMLKLCEDAKYAESDMSVNPCPDYLQELDSALRGIAAARSIAELAAVPWVSRAAALGAESLDA